MAYGNNRGPIAVFWTGVASVVVFVIALLLAWPFTSTGGGEIGVIRNGGFFDTHDFRQVVQPGSSLTWTGWASVEHDYPASQRNFVVSAAPNADSNEVISVPSKDGVQMGIEGTFYFDLTRDEAMLGRFDDKFGVRTYPVPRANDTPDQEYAWKSEEGWNAFLNFTIGNLVQNDLRQEVHNYRCSDLLASCALAQNGGNPAAVAVTNTDTIADIQNKVAEQFGKDVTGALGEPYFTNVHFVLSKVALPPGVQKAVEDAQSSFGAVTKAQADLQAAQIQAQVNAKKQEGYNACPACAEQDNRRAIPPQITVWAPGSNTAVGVR